jgi:hypothetical protein
MKEIYLVVRCDKFGQDYFAIPITAHFSMQSAMNQVNEKKEMDKLLYINNSEYKVVNIPVVESLTNLQQKLNFV